MSAPNAMCRVVGAAVVELPPAGGVELPDPDDPPHAASATHAINPAKNAVREMWGDKRTAKISPPAKATDSGRSFRAA